MDKPPCFTRRTTQERRREIAEAALEAVAKHGVEGASVSRISAAVGLSRAALYRHFPDREAILAAAMELMDECSLGWLTQSSGTNVLDRILNMGQTHASWAYGEFETHIHPLFQFAVARGTGPLFDEMRRRYVLFLEAAVELIEEGKREGSIREDVDSREIAWGLLMFAWAEDVARLVGLDEMITSGASVGIFKRIVGELPAVSSADGSHDGDDHAQTHLRTAPVNRTQPAATSRGQKRARQVSPPVDESAQAASSACSSRPPRSGGKAKKIGS